MGILRALGVAPSDASRWAWRWAHLGPIDPGAARVAVHLDGARLLGCSHVPPAVLADFGGYRLDVLGLRPEPPFLAATYNLTVGLWVVYARAAAPDPELFVEWSATPSGPGRTVKCYGDRPVTLQNEALLDRCLDLATDRLIRRGRRRGGPELFEKRRALVERIEHLKRLSPDTSYEKLCERAGVSDRTFRAYRSFVERHRDDDATRAEGRRA